MRKDNNAIATGMALLIILAIFGSVGAGTYVAYDTGYMPWLKSPEIPSTHSEADTDGCAECPSGQLTPCETYITTVADEVPSYGDVNFKFYHIQNATPSQVLADYKTDLEGQGYQLYTYEDRTTNTSREMYGNMTIGPYNVYYGVWIEGWTCVVVLAVEQGTGSCVFYAVGPIWDFEQIHSEVSASLES